MSKRLLCLLGTILVATGIIYSMIQNSRISYNERLSRALMKENQAIISTNKDLEDNTMRVKEENTRLSDMYKKWLEDGSSNLEESKEKAARLRHHLELVQASLQNKAASLANKEFLLKEKSTRLTAYQKKAEKRQTLLDHTLKLLSNQMLENQHLEVVGDAAKDEVLQMQELMRE